MELPAPDASEELIEYLDTVGETADHPYEIAAALLQREQVTHDIQSGWLMTAFDYGLSRHIGEERARSGAFGQKMLFEEGTYPTPLSNVPKEVLDLWASSADRAHSAAVRARLHHLLFERGYGNKGTHGREAASAYLAVGTGTCSRLERVNCLHWAVDLSKRIGDQQEAAKVYPALVALATESLDQEKREPGVALHALEVLAFEDSANSELVQLLERAREAYRDDIWNTSQTIRIQEEVFKSDPKKRNQLRRENVEAHYKHAETFPPGPLRMSFLEDATALANQYGLPDLADKATVAMQEMSIDDLGLKTFSASVSIPAELVNARVSGLVERNSLAQTLEALAGCEPPTGNVDNNLQSTQLIARQAPLASLFRTKLVGRDALTRYTVTSDADRLDEQLSRVEGITLGLGGDITAQVLEQAMERFSPSEEELIRVLRALPHVSEPVARSLARSLLAFQARRFEEATTVAMPRIESLVRALCVEKGVLRFRLQRNQRQGQSIPGQYPQLGALLSQLKPWIDPSWHRYLWTFLVSPFGPGYRNELLHGYTEDVTRIDAALTILAGLRLALIQAGSRSSAMVKSTNKIDA